MGFFDRFKPKHQQKKVKKVRHAVDAKAAAREAQEQTFAGVPGGSAKDASKPKETTEKKAKQQAPRSETRHAYRILLHPLVTEKSTALKRQGRYAFAVALGATKLTVKEAVLALYGVRPSGVTIQRFQGKAVRYGRSSGRTRSWKRAIVTLPAGKTLDVTES